MKKEKKKTEGSRFYRVCYALFSRIVGLLFRIRVVGGDRPELDRGNYLVCANHISAADPVILSYAMKHRQVHFMAKKELFKIPLLSSLIRMFGAFPVDRGGNDVGAIKTAVARLVEGKNMGIFPQGHRYPKEDPRKTPVKNGAALIASRAKADILPVYLWRKDNRAGVFRRTYVIIGEPIRYAELEGLCTGTGDYARMSERIFDAICTLGEKFEPENEAAK